MKYYISKISNIVNLKLNTNINKIIISKNHFQDRKLFINIKKKNQYKKYYNIFINFIPFFIYFIPFFISSLYFCYSNHINLENLDNFFDVIYIIVIENDSILIKKKNFFFNFKIDIKNLDDIIEKCLDYNIPVYYEKNTNLHINNYIFNPF
tara:strand:+ start:5896 stop:6348 length:453 start_codon:yes stop_codon:yes gene_type:complete